MEAPKLVEGYPFAPKRHPYSPEELVEFEKISFRNIVTFHREKLLQVERGVTAGEVFTGRRLAILSKQGVLERDGMRLVLTSRARKILGLKEGEKS